ncbi:MAG: bifunctional folylpolyglutamate synthase/dihydrofolate synthase [Lachnospiraceae bacterium]|nr:bifunctional folylpolyglutamate synthase/dihydrofolate synthase [Lachnospiraceae bacterium]
MKMTEDEAIEYIESHGFSREKKGLSGEITLMHALSDPQKKLRFIHVAGSNGKGSTCAMFASILQAAGYKTGLFTSPHLIRFNERIKVNGTDISGDDLAKLADRVKTVEEESGLILSQFEITTAIAMLYFHKEACDIVVLEVGMGGEFDPTNVIDAPDLAVITNIGLEHTEYLGDTPEKIALTKAGIIKPGSDCVCYDSLKDGAYGVIKNVCLEKNVSLKRADISEMSIISETFNGQTFLWEDEEYTLPLNGRFQLHNAALVLTGMEILKKKGMRIPKEAVKEGLKSVVWPARLEVLNKDPLFILDGGHNPQCIKALAESLKSLKPAETAIIIIGVLKDKDHHEMIDPLLPLAAGFVCVTPNSERSLDASDLSDYLVGKNKKTVTCNSVKDAVQTAVRLSKDGHYIVATGSLYLAGDIRQEAEEFFSHGND